MKTFQTETFIKMGRTIDRDLDQFQTYLSQRGLSLYFANSFTFYVNRCMVCTCVPIGPSLALGEKIMVCFAILGHPQMFHTPHVDGGCEYMSSLTSV
jgi:hypothetical protein